MLNSSPLDAHANNLRMILQPEAMPTEYHEAKRIAKQRDEERMHMSELSLDGNRLDVQLQMMIVRANSYDAIAERSTDLSTRIRCRARAEQLREDYEALALIAKEQRRHFQDLSEVMDL